MKTRSLLPTLGLCGCVLLWYFGYFFIAYPDFRRGSLIAIRDIRLWALVSLHIVGGAFLFRRLFPRESPWLGFIVPGVVIVFTCNFIEHLVPLSFHDVLPITTCAAIYVIARPTFSWRIMRLPTFLFLAMFAFTLFLRVLRPNIQDSRDGIPDAGLIAAFTFGHTLPVDGDWLPGVKLLHYYCLGQYGASVLMRLLGVDIGAGFNLGVALLAALTWFLVGAIAWRISRGKVWIAIAAPILTACAATGLSLYIFLRLPHSDPEALIDPHTLDGLSPDHLQNPIFNFGHLYYYATRELIPPGYGAWISSLHSTQAGQMAICFMILSLVELLRLKRTDWPWICLVLAPLLMIMTCTWGVPLCGFLLVPALIICRRWKIAPQNPVFVATTSTAAVALTQPMLTYLLDWNPSAQWEWASAYHTDLAEYAMQWWPIYLPLLALAFAWKGLHPATRIVLIAASLAFAMIETWNFGERIDMTGKSWGVIYTAAWVVLVPEIARRKAWLFRTIFILLTIASALTFCYWTLHYWQTLPMADIGHLDGRGIFRANVSKARILDILSPLDSQVIIPGRSAWALNESGLVNEFSHTRAYVTWSHMVDTIMQTNAMEEAHRREVAVNSIYDGKMADPLGFLRREKIAAVVIYPDDHIDPAIVEKLKQSLAPSYIYIDANPVTDNNSDSNALPHPCAGVFVYQSGMAEVSLH